MQASVLDVKGPSWAYGCEKCNFGRLWPEEIAGSLATAIVNLYQAGELRLCDCRAGLVLQRYCIQHAEESDTHTVDRLRETAHQRRIASLFSNAGVPPLYRQWTLDTFPRQRSKALHFARAYQQDGTVGGKRGLLLYGPSGAGKTGLLSPLVMHALANGQSALWVQYNSLMAELRDFQSGQVEDRIRMCREVDLLMIDDFGDPAASKAATDWSRDTMFRIVDHRRSHGMAILVTTNLRPKQLADQFHDRIMRRLEDMCAVVEVTA